jgi:hypothetical protein
MSAKFFVLSSVTECHSILHYPTNKIHPFVQFIHTIYLISLLVTVAFFTVRWKFLYSGVCIYCSVLSHGFSYPLGSWTKGLLLLRYSSCPFALREISCCAIKTINIMEMLMCQGADKHNDISQKGTKASGQQACEGAILEVDAGSTWAFTLGELSHLTAKDIVPGPPDKLFSTYFISFF